MSAAEPRDYDKVFDAKHARTKAHAYARKGLEPDAQRIVDLVRRSTPPGFSVLEIGGGVGEIQLELLRDGAARATNIEFATQYEDSAAELIRERGLGDRIERRLGDFVREEAGLPPADVVVMHRVVCCYPDADALVGAAADHAQRLLVMTFPVDRWWIRRGIAVANLFLAVRGGTFRAYAHATRVVLSAAQRRGLGLVTWRRGLIWQLVALERPAETKIT